MLKFLGCGGAFDYVRKNTSAYFIKDKIMFLFDCGESVFHSILNKKILDDVENINIFITHLHSDHCGSLASLIPYCFYIKNIPVTIIYDEKEKLDNLLELMYISKERYNLIKAEEFEIFKVQSFLQEHEKNSYGYLFEVNGKKIFYSGDSITLNSKALELLNNGEIDNFYQDVTVSKTKMHLSIYDLFNSVKDEYKDRLYLMHYDEEVEKAAKELNLKLVKVEE